MAPAASKGVLIVSVKQLSQLLQKRGDGKSLE
jgi:hypothetical protein